jgi:hypothetical protein
MQFRFLLLKRVYQNYPAWLHIIDTTGATIGEATLEKDGRWIVTLIDPAQAPAYGLDEGRAEFSDRHHLRDWAQDTHLRSAHSTLARLSDVDLQRLRTLAAEAVSARASLRNVEAYR